MQTFSKLDPLVTPECERCGGVTRLVGLEPGPNEAIDLCTYECLACGHVLVHHFPRNKRGRAPVTAASGAS